MIFFVRYSQKNHDILMLLVNLTKVIRHLKNSLYFQNNNMYFPALSRTKTYYCHFDKIFVFGEVHKSIKMISCLLGSIHATLSI